MKKSFESGKIWTILSAFIFMMTCGLVVFAGYTTVSSTSHFNQWSTEKLSHASNGIPILTGGDWDSIIDSLNGLVIPKGAIMAFNLDKCPEGWHQYREANNRFLMGSDGNIGRTGGISEVTLSLSNIPPHSHYYKDTVFAESNDEYHQNRLIDRHGDSDTSSSRLRYENTNSKYFNEGAGDHSNRTIIGSSSTDKDNVPIYGVRGTSKEVCDFGSAYIPSVESSTTGDNTVLGSFFPLNTIKNPASNIKNQVANGCIKKANSFSIQNPYINVKYCIKD